MIHDQDFGGKEYDVSLASGIVEIFDVESLARSMSLNELGARAVDQMRMKSSPESAKIAGSQIWK